MKDISDCINEYNHLYCVIHPLLEGNILYLKILTIQYVLSFIQKKRLWCWLTEIEDLETAQKRADRNILKRLPLAYLNLDYEYALISSLMATWMVLTSPAFRRFQFRPNVEGTRFKVGEIQ